MHSDVLEVDVNYIIESCDDLRLMEMGLIEGTIIRIRSISNLLILNYDNSNIVIPKEYIDSKTLKIRKINEDISGNSYNFKR